MAESLERIRSRLSGLHFAKEALSEHERETLLLAEDLLRRIDLVLEHCKEMNREAALFRHPILVLPADIIDLLQTGEGPVSDEHVAMTTAYDYMTETAAQVRRGLQALLNHDLDRAESILEHIRDDVNSALAEVQAQRTYKGTRTAEGVTGSVYGPEGKEFPWREPMIDGVPRSLMEDEEDNR